MVGVVGEWWRVVCGVVVGEDGEWRLWWLVNGGWLAVLQRGAQMQGKRIEGRCYFLRASHIRPDHRSQIAHGAAAAARATAPPVTHLVPGVAELLQHVLLLVGGGAARLDHLGKDLAHLDARPGGGERVGG